MEVVEGLLEEEATLQGILVVVGILVSFCHLLPWQRLLLGLEEEAC